VPPSLSIEHRKTRVRVLWGGLGVSLYEHGQVEGLASVEASLAAGEGEQRINQLFLLFAGFEHV
jgi:hypothetical protein